MLNEPEALESDPEVEYDDALTLSIELLSAEPVTSRAVTLVLNDPEVADNDPEVADREPEVAYAELLTVYNEPEVAL